MFPYSKIFYIYCGNILNDVSIPIHLIFCVFQDEHRDNCFRYPVDTLLRNLKILQTEWLLIFDNHNKYENILSIFLAIYPKSWRYVRFLSNVPSGYQIRETFCIFQNIRNTCNMWNNQNSIDFENIPCFQNNSIFHLQNMKRKANTIKIKTNRICVLRILLNNYNIVKFERIENIEYFIVVFSMFLKFVKDRNRKDL